MELNEQKINEIENELAKLKRKLDERDDSWKQHAVDQIKFEQKVNELHRIIKEHYSLIKEMHDCFYRYRHINHLSFKDKMKILFTREKI